MIFLGVIEVIFDEEVEKRIFVIYIFSVVLSFVLVSVLEEVLVILIEKFWFDDLLFIVESWVEIIFRLIVEFFGSFLILILEGFGEVEEDKDKMFIVVINLL